MKSAVVLCLIVTFAGFQFGDSLRCYSCRQGSTQKCEVKEECTDGQDGCLKLRSGEMTYTSCVNYNNCNFDALSLQFPFSQFKFSCCQSNLCNKRSIFEKLSDLVG